MTHIDLLVLNRKRRNYEAEMHCAYNAGDKGRALEYMERVLELDNIIVAAKGEVTWMQAGVRAA